jgi:hypothetical protein
VEKGGLEAIYMPVEAAKGQRLADLYYLDDRKENMILHLKF